MLICNLPYALGSLLAKFGWADVISPGGIADKAKSDDFDIWPHFDLVCDLLRIKKKTLRSTRLELSIAPSPASLRPSVRELGG